MQSLVQKGRLKDLHQKRSTFSTKGHFEFFFLNVFTSQVNKTPLLNFAGEGLFLLLTKFLVKIFLIP